MITKLLAVLAVIAMPIAINVVTLIFGWGLEPKSWLVIVCVGFLGQLTVSIVSQRVFKELAKEEE